jgi:PST family polysaccharide transporter
MGPSGTRDIAASRGDLQTLNRVRRVIFLAHLVQGCIAMVVIWLLRWDVSVWLFGNETRATDVGLIGVAVLLALMGGAQLALLRGLRQISALSRVTIIGSFIGTCAGLLAVWLWGERGIIWFVLVLPAANFLIALRYTIRLPRSGRYCMSLSEGWDTWKSMAKLGMGLMLASATMEATLLAARGRISQELGLDATGQFSAAWSVTMTYVGFLLTGLGAEYFPRLSEIIHDRKSAVELMNDQAQLGLAVGGPVALLLVGLAPWIMTLLYSAEFEDAVTMLQWQTIGNIFRLPSWALGAALIAIARSKPFFLSQLTLNGTFLLILWTSLNWIGLDAAGPAFTIAYFLYLLLLIALVRRYLEFRWQPLSLVLLVMHFILSAALLPIAMTAPLLAAALSVLLATLTGVFGLRVVLVKIGPEGGLVQRLYRLYAFIGWRI